MITYIPDGTQEQAAISRTTHLAISAHQDDIEFTRGVPEAAYTPTIRTNR